jgi:hypothetical protein
MGTLILLVGLLAMAWGCERLPKRADLPCVHHGAELLALLFLLGGVLGIFGRLWAVAPWLALAWGVAASGAVLAVARQCLSLLRGSSWGATWVLLAFGLSLLGHGWWGAM